MALQVSKSQLVKAQTRISAMQERVKRIQKQAEATTVKVVRTVEIGASAFGMGLIQGKTGGVEVMGIPLDLLVGSGLNLAGYLGVAGRASDHLNALGDGALAAYATTVGRGVGATWAQKDSETSAKEQKKIAAKGEGFDLDRAAAIAAGVPVPR